MLADTRRSRHYATISLYDIADGAASTSPRVERGESAPYAFYTFSIPINSLPANKNAFHSLICIDTTLLTYMRLYFYFISRQRGLSRCLSKITY